MILFKIEFNSHESIHTWIDSQRTFQIKFSRSAAFESVERGFVLLESIHESHRIDSQHLSHRIRTFVNPFMNRRTKTLVNLFIETGYLWDYSWIYSWNDQYDQTQFFNIRFNPMTNIGCLCIKYQYISCNAWMQFYWASHSIIIGDLTRALYKLKTILF